MADFKVLRGEALITHEATTVTITEGTDYTLESGVTSADAFCHLVCTRLTGLGQDSGQDSIGMDHWGVWISNPANIATSLTFNRTLADSGQGNVVVQWEIIQYIGAPGGANEFIVRLQEALDNQSSANPLIGATMSPDPTTDADVMIFITGQTSGSSLTNEVRQGQFTAALNTTNDQAEFTRDSGNAAGNVSYAAIEFTGSNWTVARYAHTMTAAGPQTETITAVVLAKAFVHVQVESHSAGLNDVGGEAWLSATTTLSFQVTSGGVVNMDFVAWVVENSQASGDVMNVQHVSDTSTTETAWTTTTSDGHGFSTSVIPSKTSIIGASARCTGTGNAFPRGCIGILIDESGGADSASTTIDYTATDGANTKDYRYSIVEWPAEASGLIKTVTDTVNASEIVSAGGAVTLALTDNLTAADPIGPIGKGQAGLIDTIEASEIATRIASEAVVLTDNVAVSETLESLGAILLVLTDNITGADPVGPFGKGQLLVDTIDISGIVSALLQGELLKTLTDTINISEQLSFLDDLKKAITDDLGISERLIIGNLMSLPPDSMEVSEILTLAVANLLGIIDNMAVSESLLMAEGQIITDQLTIQDSILSALGGTELVVILQDDMTLQDVLTQRLPSGGGVSLLSLGDITSIIDVER